MKKKAIIIGAGFGGLSIGIRLLSEGFDVSIYEKQRFAGGHGQQFSKDNYTFDMGPTLITAPDIINKIFNKAGKKIEDYLELLPLDPFYRVFFHDNSSIDYSGDSEQMKTQMAKFDKNDAANYDKFIEKSKVIYDSVITDGLGAISFDKITTMLSLMPKAAKIGALDTCYSNAKKYFDDFRHRFIFSFHPLFIGGNPFRVPAIYSMISYLEKTGGIWYSKGGMKSLVNAFVQLFEELGGKIYYNSEVQKINIVKQKIDSVIVADEKIKADVVISNADINHTYTKLIDDEVSRKWSQEKLDRSKYSMSAFLLYLGVKKKYDKLLHHNIILSPRYRELIDDIFDNKVLADDFSLYVHVPSKTDSSMAPEGSESIYILSPCPNLSANIDWSKMGRIYANKIINYLEADFDLIGLRDNIEVEIMFTPEDFQKQRNSYLGTPWGLEPSLLQSAYFRPHNRAERIKGLFLVGAGTHPGAGLPGVMLSAEATEKSVLEYISK